jgi:hypothetical protein
MAMIKRRVLKAEGALQIFTANLRYFKEALTKLRPQKIAQEALQETTQGSAEGDHRVIAFDRRIAFATGCHGPPEIAWQKSGSGNFFACKGVLLLFL